MIIVDNALRTREEAGNPVRVGMIGAGFMGRGLANQIINSVPGMRLAAVSNRHPEAARRAYLEAGEREPVNVSSQQALGKTIKREHPAITDDPMLLCRAAEIDALLEVTGAVEFGAKTVIEAISHGKHVILMNAELDGTIGPILKQYADRAGVILTACDGDQPGVEMNLYRFVRSLGLKPLVCGNIKGLQDCRRNPDTQRGFAEQWGQNVNMVTSFADGTKVSFEQAIVANGTGMRITRRGMEGHDFRLHRDELIKKYNLDYTGHIDDLTGLYDVDRLRRLGGVVDYVVGVKPAPGVYVFATHDDPRQRHYLNLYKLGPGPLYSFYVPCHLCHFEAPLSIARAVLFSDPVLTPCGGPFVEVVATAKTNLETGDIIDDIGGYKTYGQCENAAITAEYNLLPMGLAAGCRLKQNVKQDQVLTYSDVERPGGRLCDQLREEQNLKFSNSGNIV